MRDTRYVTHATEMPRDGRIGMLVPNEEAAKCVRVPIALMRAYATTPDTVPALTARPHTAPSVIDIDVLCDLARRILAGEHPARAAAGIGLRPEQGPHLVRTSAAYAAARQRVLADTPAPRDAIMREVGGLAAENAYRGALVQDALLRECQDPQVLARVSGDAMDRVGARAPTRVDNTVRVELGERTLELVGRALRDIAFVDALVVPQGEGERSAPSVPDAAT